MHRVLLSIMLVAGLVQAEPNLLRLAPDTGLYVEADYLEKDLPCDWYYAAARFIESPPAAGNTACPVIVRIRGTLNRDGAREFAALSDALENTGAIVTRIVLNSKGGDAVAAFRIARTIRANPVYRRRAPGVMTSIDEAESAVCFSACLVVFAAGFERHALFDEYDDPRLPSRLGMHRPGQYDSRHNRYDSSIENRNIRIVRQQLKRYFSSVGVSSDIVDDMFEVPFDDLHLLTESEAQAYGLITAP